jgi:hypothetical protein
MHSVWVNVITLQPDFDLIETLLEVKVKVFQNNFRKSSSSSSPRIRPSGLLLFHSIFLTVFLGFFSHMVCSSKSCWDSARIHSWNMFLPVGLVILNKLKNWLNYQFFLNFFISFVVPKCKTSSFPHEFHLCYLQSFFLSLNFAQRENTLTVSWPSACKMAQEGENLFYNLELFRHPLECANCVKGGSATQVVCV